MHSIANDIGVQSGKCGFTTLSRFQHKKSLPLRLGTDFLNLA